VKLHIFDVDFTIVRCSTVRAFIFRGLREGLIGPSIVFYAPLLFLRYGFKASSPMADDRAYPFLKGVPRGELEALAAAIFEDILRPKIDVTVTRRIATILRSGEKAIIASSSFGTIIEPLAAHLGISDVVASELEFREGASTGRVAGEPAFGEGKRSRVLAYLRTIGAEPGECAFYSDSHRDLPLLREVGEAVAVNPDARLRRVAREQGWEILMTRSVLKEGQYA
jgi:HAD superfamily hydrolase (TIGR01490 family)